MAPAGVEEYDYVVVGGGAAGCPLAARLSERQSNRVLLIEAGTDYPPGQEPPEILDIFAATAYSDPRFVWNGLKAAFGPRPGNAPDQRHGGQSRPAVRLAIAKLPDVQERIRQLGLIPDGSTAAAFRDRIGRDIPKYTAVAKAAGIKFG